MTELQMVLAFEAILCIAEGHFKGNPFMYDVIQKLQKEVDRTIGASYLGAKGQFANFLDEQKKAIEILLEEQKKFDH